MGVLTKEKILAEKEIGHISISPFILENLGPTSYDVTLGEKLLSYNDHVLDMKKENSTSDIIIPEEGFTLHPGTLYLGTTNEEFYTDKYEMDLSGKSSNARVGLSIHVTANWGVVGWKGKWTLEIFCQHPVKIYRNIKIGQVRWLTLDGKIEQYQGKYQNQKDVQASKSYEDYSNQLIKRYHF